MSAQTSFRTAEAEETLRVMAHIRDLNRIVAESVLAPPVASDAAAGVGVQRLEALPFLLVTFRFSDHEFWRARAWDTSPGIDRAVQPDAQVQLARHLLSVAWHSGRAGVGPRLMLGIAREVGELITMLRFSQLDAIASAHATDVQRRWVEVPDFWAQLLRCAQADNEARWSRFQLHALRLLGREQL